VVTSEVASIGDLKFQITERRDGRRMRRYPFPLGGIEELNQMLVKTKPNKFFVFFTKGRILPLAGLEKELVGFGTQLIEFIVLDVIEIELFEVFQGTMRGQGKKLTPEGHRSSPPE